MKNQKPWTFTAKQRGAVEIRLYDEIGESVFSEGTTAKAFAAELQAAGHLTSIHLRVNSPGGSVFDGISMYNILLTHGARVTATVEGLAASIAGVIIMAASEISMAKNALLMIHDPHSFISGGAEQIRKLAGVLDKVKGSMITAYQRHTDMTKDEISALMSAETWFSADEAVAAGFSEKVCDPDEDDDCGVTDLAANFDFSRFSNVPQRVTARLRAARKPLTDAHRRARSAERAIDLAVFAREPRTDAQRRAVMRQNAIELVALGRKVRLAVSALHRAELAALDRRIEAAELAKPRTDAERFAVAAKYAVELGRNPFISARRQWPGYFQR
jgi:ATP-dependent protease ClpP protease subunit